MDIPSKKFVELKEKLTKINHQLNQFDEVISQISEQQELADMENILQL